MISVDCGELILTLYDEEKAMSQDSFDRFDDMAERTIYPWVDDNYDDHNDFYSDVTADDIDRLGDMISEDEGYSDDDSDYYDDSMDGDFDSAMRDAGFGTDEDYGYYGEDY